MGPSWLAVPAEHGACGGWLRRDSGQCDTATGVNGARGAWCPVLILGDGCFGIGQAGEPPRVHLPHVVCHRLRFFPLCRCIGLRLLLRQLTRMDHHKAHLLLGDPPITVFDLDLTAYALATPAPGASSRVRPGFSANRGKGGCWHPQASSSCRMAHVRGTKVTKPMPCSRHNPKVRRL